MRSSRAEVKVVEKLEVLLLEVLELLVDVEVGSRSQ